jgi:putative MATE family efflux protein
MNNTNVLDDEQVGQLLLKQSYPALISNMVTATYNIVSTIFVGHFVGALGIAGIAMVLPLQMLSMGFGNMFGVGGASLISRSIGAGNIEKAERALGNAIAGIIIISLVVMIVGFANPDFWLRVFGTNEDIMPYAKDYFIVILFGLIFQTFILGMASLTRSEGSARIAMIGMGIGGVSNIIFDAIFIMILKMGVSGAAIGTVIAQFLSTLYFIIFYFRGRSYLKFHIKNLAFKWDTMKEILAIGISNFIMSFTAGTSYLFLNRAIVIYGGDIAMAGYGIINRLIIFTTMPGHAIGQGLQPVLGFNFGIRRYDRAFKVLKIALVAAASFGVFTFLLLYIMPEAFVRFFTSDTALVIMSVYMIKHVFATAALSCFIITTIYTFQSLGNFIKSYIITLRPVIFLLPLVLILPRFFQFSGVILAYPITEALAFILAMILLVPQLREFSRLCSIKVKVPTAIVEMEMK